MVNVYNKDLNNKKFIMANRVIEYRVYEKYVQCSVCFYPTTRCVFYCCECTHTQLKICHGCCFQDIKPCITCTEDVDWDEYINFYQFFPKNKGKKI